MSYSAGLNILEPLIINRERIQDLINSFSSIGASENGSVSRRGFSDEDIYARNFFIKTLKRPIRDVFSNFTHKLLVKIYIMQGNKH